MLSDDCPRCSIPMIEGGQGRELIKGGKLKHQQYKCPECGAEHGICYVRGLNISSEYSFPVGSYKSVIRWMEKHNNQFMCDCGRLWILMWDSQDGGDNRCCIVPIRRWKNV